MVIKMLNNFLVINNFLHGNPFSCHTQLMTSDKRHLSPGSALYFLHFRTSWDCGDSTIKGAVVLGQDLWGCEAENNSHYDLLLMDKRKTRNVSI